MKAPGSKPSTPIVGSLDKFVLRKPKGRGGDIPEAIPSERCSEPDAIYSEPDEIHSEPIPNETPSDIHSEPSSQPQGIILETISVEIHHESAPKSNIKSASKANIKSASKANIKSASKANIKSASNANIKSASKINIKSAPKANIKSAPKPIIKSVKRSANNKSDQKSIKKS